MSADARSATRGPYAKTPRVRARILEAAAAVFSEAGYRATTMKEIAARAGISQRGLVHHFPTKDDLLVDVIRAHEEERARWLGATWDTDFFATSVAIARDNENKPGQVELHTLLSAEAVSPEHPAHEHYRRRYENYRTSVADAIGRLQSRGRARTEVDPEVLAQLFIALSDGIQIQWLYDRPHIDTVLVLEVLIDLVTVDQAAHIQS